MKYAYYNAETYELLGWYDKGYHDYIPTPNIEVSDEIWQDAINKNCNKINKNGLFEIFDFRSDEEVIKEENISKVNEAKNYLSETDWVEPYLIKHSLGLEVLLESSNKLVIASKRKEAREYINENS